MERRDHRPATTYTTSPSVRDTPVASTDLLPSSALRRAAAAERQRIDRIRSRLEAREQRLREQLAAIAVELTGLGERARVLDMVISPSAVDEASTQIRAAIAPANVLRGQQLRERAAQVLLARYGAGVDVHYRRWLDDVLHAGYDIVAKDPPAAFLTTASRSPLVVRGGGPGTYRIDLDRAQSLRRQLAEAEAELADLAAVIARAPNPAPSLREHRTRLTGSLRRLEREVAEVERVLASGEGSAASRADRAA
jgi:septal ring factor EnvC (AmiA/AmiB activator)